MLALFEISPFVQIEADLNVQDPTKACARDDGVPSLHKLCLRLTRCSRRWPVFKPLATQITLRFQWDYIAIAQQSVFSLIRPAPASG